MNYVPINGLHMLAVETSILVATVLLSYLSLRAFRGRISPPHWLNWILARNWRAVLLIIAVALVGRALIMPWVGTPQPRINDEYSYLLMGDTFAHFRLTNPTPSSWQHFETFHVNLTPTYHSKYPVAQGLMLGLGEIVFHRPWIGVYLSTAVSCGAICWALQAFVPPGWAFLGGLIAVFRLALFCYWMNSYWGGSVAALGGAVALGAVVRLFQGERSTREQALLVSLFAVSLLILGTSRPFEGFAFSLPLLAYSGYNLVRALLHHRLDLRSTVLPFFAIGLVGAILMGYYNERTTGSPWMMPYVLNERTYASIPLFLGQRMSHEVPAHDPVFAKYYEVEAEEHGLDQTKSLAGLLGWEAERTGVNWLFYLGPALSLPVLIGLLLCLKQRQLWIVLAAAVTTGLAVASCSFTQVHYYAPATIAIYIFVITGLQHLWQQQAAGERALVIACVVTVMVVCLARQTATSAMNAHFRLPDTRVLIARRLANQPGRQLVLVSYDMEDHYPGDELVHNGAEFPGEKILWARSKGRGKDFDLCRAYPDRTFWGVTTNDVTYSLTPLAICTSPGIPSQAKSISSEKTP